MMKIGIILQARMESKRLPGKVLKPLAGEPMLLRTIDRLKRVRFKNKFIVATTFKKADDPIADLCKKYNIACVRGSEDDLLARYVQSAMRFDLDIVIRITADNPLVDPLIIDAMIDQFLQASPPFDYYCNGGDRGYPDGFGAEITWTKNLITAFKMSDNQAYHEHVMPFLYTNKENFRVGRLEWNGKRKNYRLTVDTPEDYELVAWVFQELFKIKKEFSFKDVMDLLDKNPEKAAINSMVKQKSFSEIN